MTTETPEVEIEGWVNEARPAAPTRIMTNGPTDPHPVSGRSRALLAVSQLCDALPEVSLSGADKDHVVRSIGKVVRGAMPEHGSEE